MLRSNAIANNSPLGQLIKINNAIYRTVFYLNTTFWLLKRQSDDLMTIYCNLLSAILQKAVIYLNTFYISMLDSRYFGVASKKHNFWFVVFFKLF